jgi:hypothetical protein
MREKNRTSVVLCTTIAASCFLFRSSALCEQEDSSPTDKAPITNAPNTVAVGVVDIVDSGNGIADKDALAKPGQSALEFRITGVQMFPGDDDSWEKSNGLGIDVIRWGSPSFGIGLEMGVQTWRVKTHYMTENFYYNFTEQHYRPGYRQYVPGQYYWSYGRLYYRPGYYVTTPGYYYTDTHTRMGTAIYTLEGEDKQMSVGPKIAIAKQYDNLRLTAEMAILYVMHDSDLSISYRDNIGTTPFAIKFDLEESVVAKAGIALRYTVGKMLGLFASAGYQFDLMKGDIKADLDGETVDFGKNEIKAVLGSVGLAIAF